MVNVNGGVVWCYKDDRWIPLQLSSIRLHGVLTQAHWATISDFLRKVANKELILQENGFTELTEKHKELMFQNSKNSNTVNSDNVINISDNVNERKVSLGQIPEDKIVEQPRRPSMPELRSLDKNNLFNINNLFPSETERKKTDKLSNENDEIVLRLLKKYCKYSRDALDDEIVSAFESIEGEVIQDTVITKVEKESKPRRRKLGYVHTDEKIYENLDFPLDSLEEDKNEHVIRWLKQQNNQLTFDNIPIRRHSVDIGVSSPTDSRKSSLLERKSSSSGFESRKSSVTTPSTPESRKSSWCDSTLNSRKSSVGSNSSCSECDEGEGLSQWHRFLKKHLSSKHSEKRLKKQRQAWSRNRRKLSSPADIQSIDINFHS